MATLENLVETYGYLLILVWTLLEGETIVIVAGAVAYHEMLDARGVALAAFVGSFTSDQLLFHLARHHADHRLVQRVRERATYKHVMRLIERNSTLLILGFRFLYGVRNVTPVALGLSAVSARKYLVLNAIAAAVWAMSFTAAGYLFGQTVEVFIGKLVAAQHKLLAAIAIGIAIYALYRLLSPWIRRLRGQER